MADNLDFNLGFNIADNGFNTGIKRVYDSLNRTAMMSYRAQRSFGDLDNQLDKSAAGFGRLTGSMGQSIVSATALGLVFGALTKKIKESVTAGIEYEKQLINIRNASGFSRDLKSISTEVKSLTDRMYSLTEVTRSYYQLYSAGITGAGYNGKTATAVAVDMAKMFSIISQGEVTLEQATDIIPALIKKTGLSFTTVYGDGITSVSRFLDKISAVINLTKMKVKDIPGMLDSTRTALSQVRGEFENMLAITGVLMTAGMSKKEAGQSYNMLVRALAKDAALIKGQQEIFAPILAMKKQKAIYSSLTAFSTKGFDVDKVFGGAAGFEKYINELILGGKDFKKASDEIWGDTFKGASVGFKNQFQKFLLNLQDQSARVMGGFTARKKLFAINKLFPSVDDMKASLDAVFSGRMSLTEYYGKLSKGLEKKITVEAKDGSKRIINAFSEFDKRALMRLIFGEDAAAQAFFQLQNYVVEVERDIFRVDAAGKRISQSPIFRKGEVLRGFEGALDYLEAAAKDSQGFADKFRKSFEESTAGMLQMKKAMSETFKTLLGETILPVFKSFLNTMNSFVGAINELTKQSPLVAQFMGGFMLAGAGAIGIAGLISALKLLKVMLVSVFSDFKGGLGTAIGQTQVLNQQLVTTGALNSGVKGGGVGGFFSSLFGGKKSVVTPEVAKPIVNPQAVADSLARREKYGELIAQRNYSLKLDKANHKYLESINKIKKGESVVLLKKKQKDLNNLLIAKNDLVTSFAGDKKNLEFLAQRKTLNKQISSLRRSISLAEKNRIMHTGLEKKELITAKLLAKQELAIAKAKNKANISIIADKQATLAAESMLVGKDMTSVKGAGKLKQLIHSPLMGILGKVAAIGLIVGSITWMLKRNIGIASQIRDFTKGTKDNIGLIPKIVGTFELIRNKGQFKNVDTFRNLLTTNERKMLDRIQTMGYGEKYTFEYKVGGKTIERELEGTGLGLVLSGSDNETKNMKSLPYLYAQKLFGEINKETGLREKYAKGDLLASSLISYENTKSAESFKTLENVWAKYNTILLKYSNKDFEDLGSDRGLELVADLKRLGIFNNSETMSNLKTLAGTPQAEEARKAYEKYGQQFDILASDAKNRTWFNNNAGDILAKMFMKFQEYFGKFEDHLANLVASIGISGFITKPGSGLLHRLLNIASAWSMVSIASSIGKSLSEDETGEAIGKIALAGGTFASVSLGGKILSKFSNNAVLKNIPWAQVALIAAGMGLTGLDLILEQNKKEEDYAILYKQLLEKKGVNSVYFESGLLEAGKFSESIDQTFSSIFGDPNSRAGGYLWGNDANSKEFVDKTFKDFIKGRTTEGNLQANFVEPAKGNLGRDIISKHSAAFGVKGNLKSGYDVESLVEFYKTYSGRDYSLFTDKEKSSFGSRTTYESIMRSVYRLLEKTYKNAVKENLNDLEKYTTQAGGKSPEQIALDAAELSAKTGVSKLEIGDYASASQALQDSLEKLGMGINDNTKALKDNTDFIYFELGASRYDTSRSVNNLTPLQDSISAGKQKFQDFYRNAQTKQTQVEGYLEQIHTTRKWLTWDDYQKSLDQNRESNPDNKKPTEVSMKIDLNVNKDGKFSFVKSVTDKFKLYQENVLESVG